MTDEKKSTFLGVPKLLIMSTIRGMEGDGDLEAACQELLERQDMNERYKVAVAFVLGCMARDIVESRP